MLNAMRLKEGFSLQDYQRQTGLDWASIEHKIAQAQGRGLIEATSGGPPPGWRPTDAPGWRPTELGRRFLNDLLLSFLA
jgi:oxygen-independent coproporphyrinogen-3 oxidase